MKNFTIISTIFLVLAACGYIASINQEKNIIDRLWEAYPHFKEESIAKRRITRGDIQPLIEELSKNQRFTVNKVGESIEGRDISLLSIGEGEIDIFLWSQMHGDESTATMALFDIFNFFTSDSLNVEKEELLKNVKLHFLPMLNPDGAEDFQRRNALGIDVNRDALRLQSPEGKILKRIRDSLDADFGFNLHDQSKYYNAQGSPNPATISFLAPAYNFEKSINESRGDAMRLIVGMNKIIQKYIPGQVARYNDDFEPRAFGDNIQKWGTSTILIESGGQLDDPEKQEIRKINFIAILAAIFSISDNSFKNDNIEDYENIPENDNKLFDLKITGIEYELLGETYILDIGINHQEVSSSGSKGYFLQGRIAELGDLSTYYGYENKDFTGYKILPGAVYPETLSTLNELKKLDIPNILTKGYSYVKIKNLTSKDKYTNLPIQVVGENFNIPKQLEIGVNPTFFIGRAGTPEFAVINGFLHPLDNIDASEGNGLIIRR